MKTIPTRQDATPPEYRILFNAITDSVTMLIFIRQSWKAHPFLQEELEDVIEKLNVAQAAAEEAFLVRSALTLST